MRTLYKITLLLIALTLTLGATGCGPKQADGPLTVRVLTMDQAAMSVDDMNAIADEFMAANPDIKIVMTYVPYENVHDKFVTGMASSTPAYDVVMVDVVWYDEWVKNGYLADVTDKVGPDVKKDVFSSAWNVVSRNDKIYGMPWLLDTKYLFYNKEILAQAGFNEPPKTWEELIGMSQAIKDQGLVEYPIVWSWKQAEATICDYTALLYGNGGSFLDASGQPAFNDAQGVATLAWMKQTLDDGLSNPASISYLEDDVLNVFSVGKAAFALNWLFMYDVANFDTESSQVVGQVGITDIPVFAHMASSLKSASVDGSSGFSVAATSPHVEAAWKFVTYLTSFEVQMKYSAKQLPIWSTAYEGANLETLKGATPSNPVTVPAFADQFQYAVLRPKISYYVEGSTALQLGLQEALTGQKTAQAALDAVASKWAELGQ